ncbi:MAG: hypothetical protein KBT75_14010 [Oleispira antarctica]|uniref:Lipoprotein n=1 Tax=Oleispira antarctica RB-8 TaxID=698738 RepID=R4YK79_OLEAN|nr:hypothetical protein [Oleispira antarctica]MBQ0793837.1 hypothetical protein [Oleispira antarctica]CCK74600.1 conserved hypothetical protein [Oleispira antarctica RB-8]
MTISISAPRIMISLKPRARTRGYLAASSTILALSLFTASSAFAASCCGGGNASSLVLPKFGKKMLDVSFDIEDYKGSWNNDGDYVKDPKGADLNQYRLNLGYAQRLANNWQASIILPYVWNDNQYPGVSSQDNGFGDANVSFWYEAFDRVTCVYQVNSIADLKPSIYLGGTLTVPTGNSEYGDSVSDSFEITGRGFYRVDANMIIEKTVYPFTVMLQGSYGKYLARSVNQESGKPVDPYTKRLGDRKFISFSTGYTVFLEDLDTVTFTAAISDLREDAGRIGNLSNSSSEMKKQSSALTTSYASADLRYVYKLTWSHAFMDDDRGKNFSATDIYTLGFSYAFN